MSWAEGIVPASALGKSKVCVHLTESITIRHVLDDIRIGSAPDISRPRLCHRARRSRRDNRIHYWPVLIDLVGPAAHGYSNTVTVGIGVACILL